MELDIHWWAVLVGTVANMILGFAWYSALFAKPWAKIVGLNEADMKRTAVGPLVAAVVTSFLTAYAVAYFMNFITYDYTVQNGLRLGAELSIGVLLPVMLSITMFQRKPIALFFIDWGYRLVGLLVVGMIIGGWGI